MKQWKRYQITDHLLIITLVISVGLFILLPFFNVFKMSLYHEGNWSLHYFIEIAEDHSSTLKNSLKLALFTTVLATFSSVCVSVYIYLSGKKSQAFLLLLLGVTMISPPFVTSLSYINLFGRRGLITYHLLKLSVNPYGMWGIVCMQALSDLSLNSLLLVGFLKQMDRSILDSARSLGANTSHLIKDIILPSMGSGIKAVALLSFLRSLADFGTPAIIGGAFQVLASESYFAVIAEGDLAKASAMNVVILIPALFIFILYQKGFKNLSLSSHGVSGSQIEVERRGWLYLCIKISAVFFLIWIGLQYSSILLSSISTMKRGRLMFTLNNIINTRPYITGTMLRSILYSLISALIGSVMGLLIGYYSRLRNIRILKVVDFVATLPYIIPGTFLGLGYLLSFNKPPLLLTGTSAIVVLNVLFKQLPFSTKVGGAAMEEVNPDTLNAIHDLGGGRWNEIKDGIVPMSKNALTIAFVNAFTATMTTIGSIIFLVYPGQKVLTMVMFDVIQSGKYDVGSVIAVLIILICLTVNGMYLYLTGRNVRH